MAGIIVAPSLSFSPPSGKLLHRRQTWANPFAAPKQKGVRDANGKQSSYYPHGLLP